jgi:hypothetical protein
MKKPEAVSRVRRFLQEVLGRGPQGEDHARQVAAKLARGARRELAAAGVHDLIGSRALVAQGIDLGEGQPDLLVEGSGKTKGG